MDNTQDSLTLFYLGHIFLFCLIQFFISVGTYRSMKQYSSRKVWDLEDTPTVTPSGAIIGLCEIQGQAALPYTDEGISIPLLISPVSKKECVWFRLSIESYQNSLGLENTGGWARIFTYASPYGFRVSDEYGSVGVDPEFDDIAGLKSSVYVINENDTDELKEFYESVTGQSTTPRTEDDWKISDDGYYAYHPQVKKWIHSRYVSPDRKQYFDEVSNKWLRIKPLTMLGFDVTSIAENTNPWSKKLRVTEEVIQESQQFYVHGNVNISPRATDLVVTKSANHAIAYSLDGNAQTLRRMKFINRLYRAISAGATFILWSILSLDVFSEEQSRGQLDGDRFRNIFIVVVVVPSIAVMVWLVVRKLLRIYNRFVRLKEQCELAKSAIDVALKRRNDLINELISTLEALMDHEQSVLERVAQLRSRQQQLTANEVELLTESYPVLQSSKNFLRMQTELGRTEEMIAMARSFTNDSILAMDNLRATLTGMIISPFFERQQRPKLI